MNEGVNPATNETIIPHVTFEEETTAHFISVGRGDPKRPGVSIQGYGMGWWRMSYQGHEVGGVSCYLIAI